MENSALIVALENSDQVQHGSRMTISGSLPGRCRIRNMKTQSVDTHPKAEAVQIDLQEGHPARRAWLMRRSRKQCSGIRGKTREMNPDMSEQA
jgi:hypothetical protein